MTQIIPDNWHIFDDWHVVTQKKEIWTEKEK